MAHIKQALILAGGLGTRLGELTRDTPKPMIPIGNKPFLEYLIQALIENQIEEFVMCVGYRSEKIIDHFGDGSKFGCTIKYAIEKDLLGTGGAIRNAQKMLATHFLIISGDNFLEIDYAHFFQTYFQNPTVGMLACWRNQPPLFKSNIKMPSAGDLIENYNYLDDTGKTYVDSGVKIFSRKLCDFFPSQKKFSLEIDVLPKLVVEDQLRAFPINNPPLDVGTLEGLEATRRKLLTKK